MRDKLLTRWVKQPPVGPNVQYLRDAERVNAWEQLGSRGSVLDVASEANVTAGLDADAVSRLDFSEAAIEHARGVLGDAVDRYEVADPERPALPFDDDAFDAAVCIGPYDWKFLDVDALTAEVHRVLGEGGRFVFSVPTPRSPYSIGGENRYRYYTPEEALALVSPHWRLAEYDLIFQFPFPFHPVIKSLPDRLQEPFVSVSWRLTDAITDNEWWPLASYLVLGVEPLRYADHLDDALACLFRPTDEDGFWNVAEERFVRALRYEWADGGFRWSVDDRNVWRYAPFALAGAVQWRASALGDDRYDRQLRRELAHFADSVEGDPGPDAMPSYGVGPLVAAFSLAADVFEDDAYEETAWDLYDHSRGRFDFDHAEDSLLAYGWSYLYERTGDDGLRDALDEALWEINERLEPSWGQFVFENETTRRHQNQMYALWGLARAIEVTDKPGYLDSVELVLDYAVEERMREDGAFLWEDVSRRRRLRDALGRRIRDRRPAHWSFLYECHQTFFVNAVAHYYRAGGERNYDRAVARAMAWIYGDNAFETDLVEPSGLGVPMRFVTDDGRIDVPDQTFKGAYEVGSYVMALTNLLDGPFGDDDRAPRDRPDVGR